MNMKHIKAIAANLCMGIAAFGLSTVSAQATLLSVPDSEGAFAGAGAVTFDDVNNVEWLDLTFSTSRSFNDVSGQFGSGGDFEGWRHATGAELTTLFASGGFSPLPFSGSTTPQMGDLIDQLGRTHGVSAVYGIPDWDIRAVGLYDDQVPGGSVGLAFLRTFLYQGSMSDGDGATINLAASPDLLDAATGNWLMRSTVPIPEPSSLVLLGSGVVFLGAGRRHKRVPRTS
jgi:hypothetical protein